MESKIFDLIPTLKNRAKKAVRILPQQGDEPNVSASKIGGLFLWSEEEPWFSCNVLEQSLMSDYQGEWNLNYELSLQTWDEKHNDNFVTVLQLRAEDFPLMRFPAETDIFQLLWCPRYHKPDYAPVCQIAWRNKESVKNQRLIMPAARYSESDLMPAPSQFRLQEIIEYPIFLDLSLEERNLFDNEIHDFYWRNMSARDGIKIGGYPAWKQWSEMPICGCGMEMAHLLTIDSDIFEDYPNRKAVGLLIGRGGRIFVFTCYECKEMPFKTVFQS